MATSAVSSSATRVARLDGRTFDVYYIVSSLWLLTGMCADAWAHNNIARLETFFTPWHGILYSGVAALGLSLAIALLYNRRGAGSWRAAIPKGYGLSYLGIALMGVAGFGDMLWHIVFGVERNVDAIFSPTHLFAMVAFGMVATGPYRAIYHHRRAPATLADHLLLAAALIIVLIFVYIPAQPFTTYTHLWPTFTPAADDAGQALAVATYAVQSLVLVGFTLYTIRRWRLRFGFFTLVLTVVAVPLSVMRGLYINVAIALVAGLLIDLAYWYIRPSMARPAPYRLFAALVPAAYFAVYNVALLLTGPVVWSAHLLFGTVVAMAILGWLLSYLALPAPPPTEQPI